jgi:nucleoside 2-deoxyribosyltransferase
MDQGQGDFFSEYVADHTYDNIALKAFISSKLFDAEAWDMNKQLKQAVEDVGIKVYLPQDELPVEKNLDAITILEANERAVDESAIFIAYFDYLDTGSAYELAQAQATNKFIVGYRSVYHEKRTNLGKMLEGFWERLPSEQKTNSPEGLRQILETYKKTTKH